MAISQKENIKKYSIKLNAYAELIQEIIAHTQKSKHSLRLNRWHTRGLPPGIPVNHIKNTLLVGEKLKQEVAEYV